MSPDTRVTVMIFLMAAYPAWARGGTPMAWLYPLAGLALVTCFTTLSAYRRSLSNDKLCMTKDPVFYGCSGLLLLTMVQWLNAGRQLVQDADTGRWVYSFPPVSFLPGAVTPGDGKMVFIWILAVSATILAVRHGLYNNLSFRRLAWLIPVNAVCLAFLGLVQECVGMQSIFGLIPMTSPFFSTFGYINHAGTFFMIMLFWCAGWCFYYLQCKRLAGALIWGGMWLLCLVSIHITQCRAVILMSWGAHAVIISGFLIRRLDSTLVKRSIMVSVPCILILIAFAGRPGGLTSGPHNGEAPMPQKTHPACHWLAASDGTLSGQWTDRRWQARIAWQIFSDYPWFGAGGNSFQYLAPLYMASREAHLRNTPGRAFVHNDPLQFFSEFGIVGAGCILMVLISLIVPIVKRRRQLPLFLSWPLLGVCLAGIHSLIDLPFRCPAVLVTAAFVLAIAGRYPAITGVQSQTLP